MATNRRRSSSCACPTAFGSTSPTVPCPAAFPVSTKPSTSSRWAPSAAFDDRDFKAPTTTISHSLNYQFPGRVLLFADDRYYSFRDTAFPERGGLAGIEADYVAGSGDVRYIRYAAEFHRFFTLFYRDRILGIRVRLENAHALSEDSLVPYSDMPALGGGQRLRGYRRGFFRDKGSLLLGAEYRYPIWDTWNAYLFWDEGTGLRAIRRSRSRPVRVQLRRRYQRAHRARLPLRPSHRPQRGGEGAHRLLAGEGVLMGCPRALMAFLLLLPMAGTAAPRLTTDPVKWFDADNKPIAEPAEAAENKIWDFIDMSTFYQVGKLLDLGHTARRVGDLLGVVGPRQADNVNALDEVPNSSWYTNRHFLRPMSLEELAEGPGAARPDDSGPWEIVAGKFEGITAGFTIKDASGRYFLLKFDSKGNDEMGSGSEVVVTKILHAAGYNVPRNSVVHFDPAQSGDRSQGQGLGGRR